ncbi:hypothetical protein RN001_003350 [Aquatica leii]|uniref:Uncharacterized protein n=1 Tax=Aquatica leii TaxID=1421715 RepID=A0AAN7PI68_9COLE|nr:hypothetical protein RN001_003350 [Aquatica leii]
MSGNPGPSRMHPDDSGFEKWCTDLLEDEDCVISDEDEDPDFIIESEHDSDSEMSAGEEGDENLDTGPGGAQTQENFYYGRQKLQKDKTKCSSTTVDRNFQIKKIMKFLLIFVIVITINVCTANSEDNVDSKGDDVGSAIIESIILPQCQEGYALVKQKCRLVVN